VDTPVAPGHVPIIQLHDFGSGLFYDVSMETHAFPTIAYCLHEAVLHVTCKFIVFILASIDEAARLHNTIRPT